VERPPSCSGQTGRSIFNGKAGNPGSNLALQLNLVLKPRRQELTRYIYTSPFLLKFLKASSLLEGRKCHGKEK